MVNLTKTTRSVKQKEVVRKWHLIDAAGKVLGRITPEIATVLQGKDVVSYVPHLDMGGHVVVINAKKVVLTGSKAQDKQYTYYSGFPGGLRTVGFETLISKNPQEVFRHAVAGMLPKNKLRDQRLGRLHVFGDEKHPFGDKFSK